MSKFFSLLHDDEVHVAPDQKVIPAKEFSKLIKSRELMKRAKEDALEYREAVAKECEVLKEQAEEKGFAEGFKQWSEQLTFLEAEIVNVRKETEKTIVSLALAAVQKILGKELELNPETIVDIVATSLKSVTQHRKVAIYLNKTDLEIVEANRPRIKGLFEHLETLSIAARESVAPGGCIIETEGGIINAQLENLLLTLETAFRSFFQNQKTNKKS